MTTPPPSLPYPNQPPLQPTPKPDPNVTSQVPVNPQTTTRIRINPIVPVEVDDTLLEEDRGTFIEMVVVVVEEGEELKRGDLGIRVLYRRRGIWKGWRILEGLMGSVWVSRVSLSSHFGVWEVSVRFWRSRWEEGKEQSLS